ncbi:MAG TPA: nucleotidyltransferase domain-containing protein [Phycisphaerae bacterium]|nr:nucleotidyltransferase domain-containing protein [Phycisphaerae bacterium]
MEIRGSFVRIANSPCPTVTIPVTLVTIMVTPTDSLAATLFGKTRQAILGLFFTHPTESFHLRQVVRLTGAGLGPVQRDLAALTRAGILTRLRKGIHVLYQANASSPVFEELKSLALKTVGAAEILRAALQPFAEQIRAAFLYGSMARGEQHAESDVDLLVISDTLTLQKIVAALRHAERKMGREINPMLYHPDEFRKKIREKHHFLTRVMSQPRLLLVGDDRELG